MRRFNEESKRFIGDERAWAERFASRTKQKYAKPADNPVQADIDALREDWAAVFRDWDAIRRTEKCLHCKGTGIAPGDGKTECGFCF